jgi:predicted hydrocarbon binding protein/KaiC/GvpD/RAD55 family RecA-like ATPase
MEKKAPLLTEIQEVPRESLLLLAGPPGAGKSTFCYEMVLNGVAAERPVIFVTTERSPSGITGLLREKGAAEPVTMNFIDAFAKTVGVEAPERHDTIEASCEDLNSISMAIARLQQKISQRDILLAFDSLTSPYLFNKEEVFRFMRLCLLKFAAEGNSVVALMDEGCGKEEDLGAMMSVADGIIRMEIKEKSRIINVVKHPKVSPTRVEIPMTWNRMIAYDQFDPEIHRNITKTTLSGRGIQMRTEVGDFVNVFWRNLASWSGMLWDPRRFPTMAYELDKQIEFAGLREGLAQLPPHMKLLFRLFMPKSLSEAKDVKKFLSRQKKPMENRGMRIAEYLEATSKKDEHCLRIYEGYNCWGLDNVGARLAFQDCGLVAGAFKALDKEDRDWNVVETKCIGLGDPYCEFRIVSGEIKEMKSFLEDIDSLIVERIHDHLMVQLVRFMVNGKPLVERPKLGSGLSFFIMHHVCSAPSLLSERYRMALRMGGAKAGKEVGEHLTDAGVSGDEAIKRVINFMEYCKVGKINLGETIRMWENCESFGLETGEPSCNFTTGFLNGLFSAVKNQHVREVKCIAAGDPCCEWEIM